MNFNIDMIDDIESTENYYAFVFHANFEEIGTGYKPPIWHEKINHYIGVSDFATEKAQIWIDRLGKEGKAERCYNPLTLEPKKKVIHLLSACRLDDKVKGGERTRALIKALDEYCEKNNTYYVWDIYTNPYREENGEKIFLEDTINSKNVFIKEPRVDIRPFIADSDYVLQLSNDMETYCYTINEALGYGVPIITTPLSILNELPITDNEHIVLNYDLSNIDEVVEQIFNKKVKPFKYEIPKDDWNKFLVKGKNTYTNKPTQIICINRYWDNILKKYIEKGTIMTVSEGRANWLEGLGVVKIIKEEQNSIK